MTYNNSFQDRAGQAAEAKQKALERYRARPQVDDKVAAERLAAGQQRAEARAQKAADKRAEKEAEKKASAEASAVAEAASAAAAVPKTEAELKAARDARYAKRKNRK